ncbi:MAG TPA: hypothetical protein VD998_04050 [Verrucomicrobiae bacterium]|nr:hypothetical protein [Verrucomicrobiae bacterium]
MKTLKILGFGLINYIVRFAVGGALFMGAKMNPTGFWYGFILTAVAFVVSLLLLKFVMKPSSLSESLRVAFIWVIMCLALDAATAKPIVQVDLGFLFTEIQTWTRSLIILVAALFAVKKNFVT